MQIFVQRFLGRIGFVICAMVVMMGAMISTPASATIQRGETTVLSVHTVSHVATTGSLSGTVTAASDGAPLAGICVQTDPPSGGGIYLGFATTASDGTYTISGLPARSYDVRFFTGCGNGGNYAPQWYNDSTAGAPLPSGASAIAVTAGSTTTAIDAEMGAGATISGTVTDASGGAPLAGICVSDSFVGGGSGVTTASDGTYTISGQVAGSYDVEFSTGCGNSGNYAPQWYNGTSSGAALQSGALAITVTAGSSTTGINAAMFFMGAQNISFTSTNPGSKTVGATSYTPTASATSGLSVTISLDPSSAGCSLTSGVVSFTGIGTCVIDANQAGDANYSAAHQVHQSVTVTMALPARPATITVAFAAKSSALSARAKKALQALSKKLATGASLNITGYAEGNTTLAKSRAKVVANYLSSRVALHVTLKFVMRTSENRVTVSTTKQ